MLPGFRPVPELVSFGWEGRRGRVPCTRGSLKRTGLTHCDSSVYGASLVPRLGQSRGKPAGKTARPAAPRLRPTVADKIRAAAERRCGKPPLTILSSPVDREVFLHTPDFFSKHKSGTVQPKAPQKLGLRVCTGLERCSGKALTMHFPGIARSANNTQSRQQKNANA